MDTCEQCKYWNEYPKEHDVEGMGECRVRSVAMYPQRHRSDWCGEFKAPTRLVANTGCVGGVIWCERITPAEWRADQEHAEDIKTVLENQHREAVAKRHRDYSKYPSELCGGEHKEEHNRQGNTNADYPAGWTVQSDEHAPADQLPWYRRVVRYIVNVLG